MLKDIYQYYIQRPLKNSFPACPHSMKAGMTKGQLNQKFHNNNDTLIRQKCFFFLVFC
jgi:hypothetical protein